MAAAICRADEVSAQDAESLVTEYLADVDEWRACVAAAPQLALCAATPEVVGVCYGRHTGGQDGVVLKGIAVEHRLQRQGIATRLLRAFETSVVGHGGRRVSLGSANGAAELFYLSNGYEPVGYLFSYPHLVRREQLHGLSVTRYRPGEDQTLVNVANPDGYQPEVREHMRQRHGAAEAIYIFAKTLAPHSTEAPDGAGN